MSKLPDLSKESSVKQQMRRENNACFIPKVYFLSGKTKKDLDKEEFIANLKKAMSR